MKTVKVGGVKCRETRMAGCWELKYPDEKEWRLCGHMQCHTLTALYEAKQKLAAEKENVAAIKSSVVFALEGATDYEDLPITNLNYLQGIRKLKEAVEANGVRALIDKAAIEVKNERIAELEATLDGDPHMTATPEQRRMWRRSAVAYANKCEKRIAELEACLKAAEGAWGINTP